MTTSNTRLFSRLPTYLFWLILLVCFLFPIYWLAISSFKTEAQQFVIPPLWVPAPFTLKNYVSLFTDQGVTSSLWNSLIITFFTLLCVAILGIPAAYSMARFRVGGTALLLLIFAARLLPPTAYMIPFFALSRTLGLYDKHFTLILLYTFFGLPLAIWMLYGFFSEIPQELEEAAMIDGASRLQALLRVVLPIIYPGLGAVSIFILLTSWNEFPLAVVLTVHNARTLPVVMYTFVTNYSIAWGELTAAGLVSAAPIVIAGLLVQKYLVRGLVSGAVK